MNNTSGCLPPETVFIKTAGAYAGSEWKVIILFIHGGKRKVVAESVAVPGLLHIFADEQLIIK